MKAGKTLQELATEIYRQNNAKKDYIANTSNMQMIVADGGNKNQGFPVLNLHGLPNFGINDIAHDQISIKLSIPSKYYNRMLTDEPELLATNVNHWFHRQPENRMIRTLDGTARAFLSNRYRRIDNYAIAEAVLPIIADMHGATVESCEITEKRMYLKILNPRIETEIVPGDIVQSGLLISNSEIGLGAVSIMPLVYRLVCKNGMIAEDSGQKKFHIGRTNECDDNYELFRSETIETDDKAFIMKLQDIVHSTADKKQFERIVSKMRDATEAKITSTNVPSVVELTAKTYGFQDSESKSILDHLIRGEELSLYGLANAVTKHAQDVDSYDRSTELEATAWNILTMPHREWQRLNAA